MAKQENKQITPLITMDEETERLKPLESEELLKIDDSFLDLKHRSVFFYNILSLYNKYIIKYIYNYLDNHLKDYIINYLDNKYSLLVFRKDEIVREGKPLVKDTLKVSLEVKEVLEGLRVKYPTLDIDTEYEKFSDYKIAHGKRYKNQNAAFRNWCRNAVEYQAKNGIIKKGDTETYKELFDE